MGLAILLDSDILETPGTPDQQIRWMISRLDCAKVFDNPKCQKWIVGEKTPFPQSFWQSGTVCATTHCRLEFTSENRWQSSGHKFWKFFDFRKQCLRPWYMIYHCKINRNHVRLAQVLFTKMLSFQTRFREVLLDRNVCTGIVTKCSFP